MVVLATAGTMLLSACGSEPGAGDSLAGKSFLSVSVTEDGKAKQLAPNTRLRLQFRGTDVLADAGCNSLGGQVSTDDGRLTVNSIGGTDMGCDPARHAQDEWLAKLLQDRPQWKLEADLLTLTRGATTLVLQDRETAQVAKPLNGTTWSLDTIISGETASHGVGFEKARLTFSSERVTGSTGCNDLQGIVAKSGNKLTFGELSTTRKACAGEAAMLEQTLLGTLKGELTYTIEGDRLKLHAPDGNGLEFTAG